MHALAGVGRRIGLGEQLRLGRGEELTGGRDKSSIVADAVEAVIGAVYLQHGLDVTRLVIHRLFGELLTAAPQLGAGLDWKTSLQELSAGRALGVPEYRVTEAGTRPRQDVRRDGDAERERLRVWNRADEEGSRAGRRRGDLHEPAGRDQRRCGGSRPAGRRPSGRRRRA